MDNIRYKQEVKWAGTAVLAGLVLAVILCGDNDRSILLYSWVPQGLLLVAMSLFGARPAALGGAALASAAFMGFFSWWVHAYAAGDAMAWLLYPLSLPGGFVAGIAAARRFNRLDARPPLQAGLSATTWVMTGIAINHVLWYLPL